MKRVSDNPPPRFPDRPITEAAEKWWVAKVKPRQEKALAFDFIRNNIEYYLPFYTKTVRRKDNNKPRKTVLPLFPGYISFCMNVPQNIFIDGRIAGIIEVKYQKRFMEELTQIRSALEGGVPLEPLQESYATGQEVEVTHGPLRGIRGMVADTLSGRKLILSVEGLGRASVGIDIAMVKPV